MPIALVITLLTVAWSAGLYMGILTAKFVSKKEFNLTMKDYSESHREDLDQLWSAVDNIRDALIGKKVKFVLRMEETKS